MHKTHQNLYNKTKSLTRKDAYMKFCNVEKVRNRCIMCWTGNHIITRDSMTGTLTSHIRQDNSKTNSIYQQEPIQFHLNML